MAERAQITVKGIVQGVGFRPYVYALATNLGLTGHVFNTADGVYIDVEGNAIADFIRRLPIEAPPLSRITDISTTPLSFYGYSEFTIQSSRDHVGNDPFTHVSSDVSVCSDCLRELNDPKNRRFRYPFINCTNCGPRYSITRAVPYDRPNTTMADFSLCPECSREYHDPSDRRFHAQPIACPVCGPRVEFKVVNPRFKITTSDPFSGVIEVLQQGGIVAIKGLGGFHIACDALNHPAVASLRERKRRSNKPFAVMAASTNVLRDYCELTRMEQAQLESPKHPVVLLRKKRPECVRMPVSVAVAPNNNYMGCMLPYTPLHALLFLPKDRELSVLKVLVMTSGNLSEEPIVHENNDAIDKLSGIVDAFLLHDRDIFMRVDDSVVRVRSNDVNISTADPHAEVLFIRRSRGYVPEAISLRRSGPEVLGVGADVKNTFTLTKGSFAIPSQHIGDMENYETLKFFEETLSNLKQVYRVEPSAIAHDMHPGYLSTRWALDEGAKRDLQIVPIQHHYAHIGSVMAEHGIAEKVIGVACDGTGYGTDGNVWGGEFLIADVGGFERAGQFKYVPLPGGEAAVREPWKMAVSYVAAAEGDNCLDRLAGAGLLDRHGQASVEQIMKIAASRDLSPISSGAGRLFDAVSAMLGICDRNTFEGEAAIALETITIEGIDAEYPVVLTGNNGYTVLDFGDSIKALLGDLLTGASKAVIATRFHNTVASGIRSMVKVIHDRTGIRKVVLSGGTFQNSYLLARTIARLTADGMQVYINAQMPPNDACISLGQAYIVRERIRKN